MSWGVAQPAPGGPTSSCCSTWSSATWSCARCCRWCALVSRLPRPFGAAFAAALDLAARPFHAVNYLGTCAAALVFNRRRMLAQLDRTLASLHRSLGARSDAGLQRGMPFPQHWDPFFTSWMSVAEVYHYATQHYAFHRAQLSFTVPGPWLPPRTSAPRGRPSPPSRCPASPRSRGRIGVAGRGRALSARPAARQYAASATPRHTGRGSGRRR